MRGDDSQGELDRGIRMALVAVIAAVVTASGVIGLGKAVAPAFADAPPAGLVNVSTR